MKAKNIGAALLSLSAATVLLGQDALNGCVSVMRQPTPTVVMLTLRNQCGKDITAYFLDYKHPVSGRVASLNTDLLVRLASPSPEPDDDILRNKGTVTETADLLTVGPEITVTVTAVLFADRSAAGRPEDVSQLRETRRRSLITYEEEYVVLKMVTDYVDAGLTLRERAAAAAAARASTANFLAELVERFDRSDPERWAAFVEWKRQRLATIISLFQQHLREPRNPGAAVK